MEIAPLAPPLSNKQLEATLQFRHSSNFHPIFYSETFNSELAIISVRSFRVFGNKCA
jgi:hypothetical protein